MQRVVGEGRILTSDAPQTAEARHLQQRVIIKRCLKEGLQVTPDQHLHSATDVTTSRGARSLRDIGLASSSRSSTRSSLCSAGTSAR